MQEIIKNENVEKLKKDITELAQDVKPVATDVIEKTKKVAEKTVEEVKKTKRKTKKKLKKDDLYLQVNGQQYDLRKIVEKIKEENPEIKELSVYVKPEDNMVYYVVDDVHKKFEL